MRWRHPSGKGTDFFAGPLPARLEDVLHRFSLSPILRQIGCGLSGILDLAIAERKTFGKRVHRFGPRAQAALAQSFFPGAPPFRPRQCFEGDGNASPSARARYELLPNRDYCDSPEAPKRVQSRLPRCV